MSINLLYKGTQYKTNLILWDRDSYFIDFQNYWSRLIGTIAQKIAEHTSKNWDKFNLIRTEVIKIAGINPDSSLVDPSSPINNLPLNIFPILFTSSLKYLLKDKKVAEINFLFQDIIITSLQESQAYIKDSITLSNLEIVRHIDKNVKQILVTNDSKENNKIFLKEAGLNDFFTSTYTQSNKEQLDDLLINNSLFLTKNIYLHTLYKKKNVDNVLLIENLLDISIDSIIDNNLITINVDGASKGNPGPASIGILFCKNSEIIKEISEAIGIHTNNFAEYTALIRALEIAIENNFHNIEIKSDSELVVNQVNRKYKVRDPDIKELFDKADSLIKKLSSFKIMHVLREENLRADKLANNALKSQKVEL